MKDESRELIEQYKDMYQKLNEQSIFSLRTYGREIGVAQPTLKKKEELIIHIIKIMNGLEAPAKQSNKGAHPKSQKVVWEKEDKSIKPVADDEGDKMVDLKITQNELVTLAELVYLGSILMEGSEKDETILRSNELCNKIFCKYYQLRFGVPGCVGKSNNERILYSIDVITSALLNKKQVSFLYYDVDVNGKKLYRKDKERYVVNPLGLVYSGEYFYLVCFHDKYGDPANYRIDKMEDVCDEKQSITKKKEYDNFDLNAYRKESFSMFSGEKVEVTLFFPRDLIYVAKERFGDIIPVTVDNGYIIHTTVRVSKTFFAWLSTFEGQVKIIDPKPTRQQFKEFITGILAKIE